MSDTSKGGCSVSLSARDDWKGKIVQLDAFVDRLDREKQSFLQLH